jgi:ADP-ribose pyrophosphatase YjhB (NUDIX family)
MNASLLDWARHIQSIAQAGLTYAQNPFDRERYEKLMEIASQLFALQSQDPPENFQAVLRAEAGYLTPKVDVRAGVIQDGRILLVREMLDGGRWTLPGGWVDPGDTPSSAVEREVREETGYEARAVKLVAVFDRDHQGHPPYLFSIFKLYFLCKLTGGTPRESIETGESRFFSRDEIPELSLARTLPRHIEMLFRHDEHPDLPAEFD